MANSISNEAIAIETAYQDYVKSLFVMVCTNLTHRQSDQEVMEKFTTGLNIAKHARDLVLKTMAPASAPALPSAGATTKRGKKAKNDTA